MQLKHLWILGALALVAGCGGNGESPQGAAQAPVAVEDIAAGVEVPESEAPPDTADTPVASVAASESADAPTSARFQLGTQYNRLSPTQPTSSSPDKIEVAEVFWYGCPHCYAFDPYVKRWLEHKPEYVSFVRVPAVWNSTLRTHAQAFYTAEALGKGAEMHDALFREIHENRNMLDTPEKLQAFFGKFGVNASTFKTTWESFAVQTKMQRADELSRRYKISSVPTIVVNGKYTTDAGMVGGYDDLLTLVDELVQAEHAHK